MAEKIEITAELKDLISGHLKDITAQTDKLENSLKRVSKAGASKGGGFFNTDMNLMAGVTAGTLAANAITNLAGAVVGFGKSTVDSLVNYEYFHASLKTMLKGDVEMANALEGKLVTLAKTTPFSLVEVQQGTKQLMAYGFSAGSVVENMKMLGDVSAGVGKPLGEVTYLYGTLKTQGRAFAKDINQFTSAGIPIVKELAKQFKTTDDNVMQLVSDGKVGFKEVEKAFKSMTSEGSIFFNLMSDQSKTVGGQISALGDSWEQLKVSLGKSQTGIINFIVKKTGGLLDNKVDILNQGNFIDEAFKESKAPEYDILQTANAQVAGFEYFSGGLNEMKKEAGTLMDLIKGVTDSKTAKESLDAIENKKLKLKIGNNTGDISDLEYLRRSSLYTKATKEISGVLKLLGSKEEVNSFDKEKQSETPKIPSSLDMVAKGNRPTQFNISIENLVREYKPQVNNNNKEIVNVTQADIAKALISAVNDISVINLGQ
jgi:hypothetical protein